jgi:hypothetical protein
MGKLSIHDNFISSIMAGKNIAKDYFRNYFPPFLANPLDFGTLEQNSDTYYFQRFAKDNVGY